MTLQEKAEEALQKAQIEERQHYLETMEHVADRVVARFVELFGEEPDEIQIVKTHKVILWADGLQFQGWEEYFRVEIALKGVCPECGEKVWSFPIRSLAELGRMLEDFRPAPHTCSHQRKGVPPTTGEALIEALEEYIIDIAGDLPCPTTRVGDELLLHDL